MNLQVRKHLFTFEELAVLATMRGTTFERVVSDRIYSFRFELRDHGWEARPQDFPPLSQNTTDELLAVRVRPLHRLPAMQDDDTIIATNVPLLEILVVRTLVWFTDHVDFTSPEEAAAGLPQPKSEVDQKLQEMVRKSTGGHEEVVTHPAQADDVEAPCANLVDTGFIARTEEADLACFSWRNGFIRESDYVCDANRDDVLSHYELIPLDRLLEIAPKG